MEDTYVVMPCQVEATYRFGHEHHWRLQHGQRCHYISCRSRRTPAPCPPVPRATMASRFLLSSTMQCMHDCMRDCVKHGVLAYSRLQPTERDVGSREIDLSMLGHVCVSSTIDWCSLSLHQTVLQFLADHPNSSDPTISPSRFQNPAPGHGTGQVSPRHYK
jgi:hypothetical protein